MGDKAASRKLAATLGITVPAGYDDDDQSDAALTKAAERIGYPLLVKPAAGGGGKGMRTVRFADRLTTELAAARREAQAAFHDDRLILERLLEGARHVEIQVLFDAQGNGVHLGERDCSIQRRHQKVLEEAPSPAVDAALRRAMGEAALALAGAVGYVSAGTCEFLLDDRGTFTFLEMNTRLQVEHPVTELTTGRDLVADQLRIAAGEPLGFSQADVHLDGHAIEVRLYAEDAEHGFLPATGRIERLRWPIGEGVRVDAGVAEGDEVGGRFDPMLAKIIARGHDRADALDRLTRALDQTVVLGLTTNLRFLRWLVREPVVRDGGARTDTLDRIWPPDDWDAARQDPRRRLVDRRAGPPGRRRRPSRHDRGTAPGRLPTERGPGHPPRQRRRGQDRSPLAGKRPDAGRDRAGRRHGPPGLRRSQHPVPASPRPRTWIAPRARPRPTPVAARSWSPRCPARSSRSTSRSAPRSTPMTRS